MLKGSKCHEEVEEEDSVIRAKCTELAEWMRNSKRTIIYTGAGISTAASIPDYRGPNGVWTLAEKGISVSSDPISSCPTTSHMILKEMCRAGIVRHILSQNCDGLHLRSGLPQSMLSEIHGNMHIEVCSRCKPSRQYIRSFDVTCKSQFRSHGTGRYCYVCHNELVDTIVHFGESGNLPWPLNWRGVISILDKCDLIICIGSSLAVLKHYDFLWPKQTSSTRVVIINLQWTPKDRIASLKINAKSDVTLEYLAEMLGIPITSYCRVCDLVLHPRRNTRVNELRDKITDCSCHRYSRTRSSVDEDSPKGSPGWWSASIKALRKSIGGSSVQRKHNDPEPGIISPEEDETQHGDLEVRPSSSGGKRVVKKEYLSISRDKVSMPLSACADAGNIRVDSNRKRTTGQALRPVRLSRKKMRDCKPPHRKWCDGIDGGNPTSAHLDAVNIPEISSDDMNSNRFAEAKNVISYKQEERTTDYPKLALCTISDDVSDTVEVISTMLCLLENYP